MPAIPRLTGGQHVENGRTSALTPRQQELVCLIAQGLTNREIAQRLGLSVFTVKHHVSHILSKLGVKSRTQVAFLVGQHQNNQGLPAIQEV
jgi:DNA-binding NarL/FixJ family response regulator